MILEVEKLEDLISETNDKSTIRIAELQAPLQDEKGKPLLGLMVVYTTKVTDYIVKYVESVGTAPQNDKKKIDELYVSKETIVKRNNQLLSDKGRAFKYGIWSIGGAN